MTTASKTYTPDCILNLKYRRHEKERRFSPKIKFFWQFLVHKMGDDDQLTCEVKEWAEKYFNVSSQTVRNWLQFFEERKLIKITGGGKGRGRKWVIKFSSWVRKKIELVAKGVRSTTKERLNELEAEYLKSVSWTGKNLENPNKEYKPPKYKNSLRTNTQGNSEQRKKTSAKGWKKYQKRLCDVSDETILEGQGTPEFDRYMAMIRKWLWQEQGLSIELDEVISKAVGALVKHKPFSFAIRVWNRLRDNIGKILTLVEKAVSKSKIYSIVRKFLTGKGGRKRKRRGKLPDYIDGDTYDLQTREGREKLDRDCKRLLKESDGDAIICPRCGRELTEKMYRYPLRFYDSRRCECVYISRCRRNEEVERKKAKFFGEKSPSNPVQDCI